MKKISFFLSATVLAIRLTVVQPVLAETSLPLASPAPDKSYNISFTLENDLFSHTDRHYTNGVRLSYLPPESSLPVWLEDTLGSVPFFIHRGHRRLSFSLGQNMYTPKNIRTRDPDPRDRPYAGWLYGSMAVGSFSEKRADRLELDIGVVGPASLAGQTQKFVHRTLNRPKPMGWSHQLKNEPGLILSYERKWPNYWNPLPGWLQLDMTPHAAASLGNVFTYAATGVTFRLGNDLPADYGPPLIRPSASGSDFFVPRDNFGWYVFAGVEGRAVARNIFLDGNTFAKSRHVDKNNFVGDLQIGVALSFDSVRLSYTQVYRTKEFKSQEKRDSFGAVAVSARF